MSHFITKCSCGVVLAQCRCSDTSKPTIISHNACPACREAQAKELGDRAPGPPLEPLPPGQDSLLPACHEPRAIIVADTQAAFNHVRTHLGVAALRVSSFSEVDTIRGLDPRGWRVYLGGFANTKLRDQLLSVLQDAGFTRAEAAARP